MRHVIVKLNQDGISGVVVNAHEIDYTKTVDATGVKLGSGVWLPPAGCVSVPVVIDKNGDTPCTGWQYDGAKFTAPVPQPATVPEFTPLQIIHALRSFDPVKAKSLLDGIDELDRAEFYAAVKVRADEPRLVAGLATIGLTVGDLAKYMSR